MSYHTLPPDYYLQFYSPPAYPQPPPTLHTTSQKFLRFREFHNTHFIQNRNFFRQALNPTIPLRLWKVEEEKGMEEEAAEGRSQQQAEWYKKYTGYEYQEGYYEEGGEEERFEEEPEVEFVLSEEAIAMFRFSELRRQQLATTLPKNQSDSSPTSNDFLDTEPDPLLIPSFHNQPGVEFKELYGDSCTIINTLEAAVNSTFVQSFGVPNKTTNSNREVVYWPVLPLRFA